MEPTVEKAREFALEKFEKFSGKEREFRIKHCEYMILAALELVKEKNIKIDMEKIRIAAWLHDVGYVVSEENHAEHSIVICSKIFDIDDVLKDCILNHGSKGKPETIEGKMIHMVDKLCFFYPDFARFYVEALIEEGKTKQEAEKKIKEKLEKYKSRFPDNEFQRIADRLENEM